MKRRNFIKAASGLFVPMLLLPRKSLAQGLNRSAGYRGALTPIAAGGGGGGGPTLIAQDNFDSYTDQSSLDLAANWVGQTGTINVNKPASDGSLFSGASAVGLYYHTATFNANQRAECTIDSVAAGGNFDWIGPAVRIQPGSSTGYIVVFSSTDLYLVSINAGTEATIISDTGMTLVAGNRIAIEANGAGAAGRLKVQVDTTGSWVDKWTNQNPSVHIDGGSAGVGSWLLSSSSNRLDDWKGYDL